MFDFDVDIVITDVCSVGDVFTIKPSKASATASLLTTILLRAVSRLFEDWDELKMRDTIETSVWNGANESHSYLALTILSLYPVKHDGEGFWAIVHKESARVFE